MAQKTISANSRPLKGRYVIPLYFLLDSTQRLYSEYIPHDFEWFLNDSHGQMGSIVDQPRYVVFWHLWELLLEDTFEPSHYDQAFPGIVVVNDAKLDLAIALFYDGRL